MSVMTSLMRWARKANPMRADPDRLRFIFGRPRSGVPYSIDIAMTYSAVFAAVRLISETVGQLAWHVFTRTADGGRKLDDTHPVDYLLHTQPNPELTSMIFRETLQSHALMWGNGYAEIERNTFTGLPVALWPLPPDRTTATRTESGKLVYESINDLGETTVLQPNEVFHLRGLSFNGTKGYSVIELAREGVGLALAAEYFGGAFFGRAARPTGYIEYPGKLSEKGFKKIAESLRDEGGIDNQLHPMLLDGGMKWVSIGIPPDDAQFLETRKFQVKEIARWFRVPLHKLADLEDSSVRANIEAENISFVTDSIQPWVTRWEQESNAKLLIGPRRRRFTRMNLGTLLRGDTKARYEGYKIAREIGLMNVDEQRALEDMNPIGGVHGSQYIVPMNFTTAEGLAEAAKPKSEPKSAVVQREDDSQDGDTPSVAADRVAVGQRGPVMSIIERAVTRECKAIRAKTIGDIGKFHEWLDKWFDSHVDSVIVECSRVMGSAVEACGGTVVESRNTLHASLALEGYRADSVAEIMEAVTDGTIDDLLELRMCEIPKAITDQITDAARTIGLLSILENAKGGTDANGNSRN